VTEKVTEWGEEKLDALSVRKPSNSKEVFSRVSLRTGLNDARELNLDRGNVMGRCLPCALSLHFECAFVLELEGVGVSSSRQVFFLASLSDASEVFCHALISDFFEFLVIFKAHVKSSVYWSMLKIIIRIFIMKTAHILARCTGLQNRIKDSQCQKCDQDEIWVLPK
jgi:hypothetical protein